MANSKKKMSEIADLKEAGNGPFKERKGGQNWPF